MTAGSETVLPGGHDGRCRTVRRTSVTDPMTAYRLVSDVVATAAHSAEVSEIVWDIRVEPELLSVGDRFAARNRIGNTRWTSTAVVVDAEPGRRFAFAVRSLDRPQPSGVSTSLSFRPPTRRKRPSSSLDPRAP